ncbi:transposase, partial [Paenibacillus daejeonensis]|uniref:transposase n=1 Tax=Paenibacillus daejeonensis TaxID=135193 RepID=UPI000477DB2B
RIRVVAPVPASTNPKKGLPHDAFTYDPKADAYQCPQGNRSEKKSYIKQSQGWQYKFNAEQCNACPMHERCTTSEKGRTVFHSIFYAQYEQARKHNATVTGAAELRKRGRIERKNNELKNHCGLGKVWTCSKEAAAIKAHLAGIVVNLKRVSRRFSPPGSGLIRHAI